MIKVGHSSINEKIVTKPLPNKMYHITKTKYVNDILKKGLIPGVGFSASFEREDNRDRIFLTTNWEYIASVDDAFSQSEQYSLLLVDVRDIKSKLKIDHAYDIEDEYLEEDNEEYDKFLAYYYKGTISADKIKLLGRLKIGAYSASLIK